MREVRSRAVTRCHGTKQREGRVHAAYSVDPVTYVLTSPLGILAHRWIAEKTPAVKQRDRVGIEN